jgi:cytochrome c biogenesis factor
VFAWALALANRPSDRVGEIALAAATVVAVVLVAATLPAVMRRSDRSRRRITPALVIVTGGAAVTFVAYLAFAVRCTQSGCNVRPGDSFAGVQPWWRIKGSWQWGAQLALASAGFAIASVALAMAAGERRRAGRAVNVARVVYGLWALLVFVIPAAWEIFVI